MARCRHEWPISTAAIAFGSSAERIPSPSQYSGNTCPVHCRNTGRCVGLGDGSRGPVSIEAGAAGWL